MKRKLIFIATVFFAVVLGLYVINRINSNLEYYSAYYAHHMPHDETEHPELSFVLRSLDMVEKPKDFQYHIRDRGTLVYIGDYLFEVPVPGFDGEIRISNSFETQVKDSYGKYYLSSRGKFLYTKYYNWKDNKFSYSKTSQEEAESIRILQETLDPVMKVQPTEPPSLNLQWLFNYVNKR